MAARFTFAFLVMSRMETRSRPCSPNNSSATSRIRDLVSLLCFIRSFQTNVLTGAFKSTLHFAGDVIRIVPKGFFSQFYVSVMQSALAIYRERECLAEYPLPADGVRNGQFSPEGLPKPPHHPHNCKQPTQEEEKRLRAIAPAHFRFRRCLDSRFDTCVQAPICNSPAIHFSLIVVSARNRCAMRTLLASPLRRRFRSSALHPIRCNSAATMPRAFCSPLPCRSSA